MTSSPERRTRRCKNGRRLVDTLRKEVRQMRITLHIGPFKVTITISKPAKKDRHSGK